MSIGCNKSYKLLEELLEDCGYLGVRVTIQGDNFLENNRQSNLQIGDLNMLSILAWIK